MTTVRGAVVQAAPVPFDRERTLDRVAQLTAEAAERGAQLVVFPEAFVSAYPWGASFGARRMSLAVSNVSSVTPRAARCPSGRMRSNAAPFRPSKDRV